MGHLYDDLGTLQYVVDTPTHFGLWQDERCKRNQVCPSDAGRFALGANVGIASIFFELETDTPDSLDMYAFEPLPLNAEALRRNLSA